MNIGGVVGICCFEFDYFWIIFFPFLMTTPL